MEEMKVALVDGDRDRIVEVLNTVPDLTQLVKLLAADGVSLLAELCKLGLVDLLDAVISCGVKVKEANNQENLVSTAVLYNQTEVLDYLLSQDLPLLGYGMEAWHELSPFYIASKRGQADILRKLYSHKPGLVKENEVRASLLYASCQGGSIDCFKLWISPGIDINSSITLVQSDRDFGNFERNTPLYAVCSGGHKELLCYMMENFPSLELTQTACNEYPDLLRELVERLFVPVSTVDRKQHADRDNNEGDDDEEDSEDSVFQMCVGNLHHKNLHMVHPSWLVPFTVTLQQLHLAGNKLTELPASLPWDFQNLQSLDISNNCLKYFTGPKHVVDDQPLCPSLTEINLSYNKLVNVCVEVFCIPSLRNINLSHNNLSFLQKTIHQDVDLQQDSASALKRNSLGFLGRPWECRSLMRLDVSHNELQMFPSDITECKSLAFLLANNNHLTTFPQPWECPLEHLDLSDNQLERFPVDTEKYWCGSLNYLNISNNKLDEINEGIVKLSVLSFLDASNNRIERLPATNVWECGHLNTLNLKNNKLGQPIEKSPLKGRGFTLMSLQHKNRLSLSSEDSSMVTFPDILATCLRELRLTNNNLDCVPPSVCNLRLLEILDISENPLIRNLPVEIGKLKNCGMLKLKGLTIDNIKDIPTEGGAYSLTKKILAKFMDKLRDTKEYNKLKTIVLGKKDKGKTTLVNILANKKHIGTQENKSIIREEVITKRKTSFSLMSGDKKSSDVLLNVWDIAGDEAYTLIHHSMFTKHTLYLLVWDFWSIEAELDEIGKWLYNIQAASQYYTIILIGTFLDKKPIKDEEVREMEDRLKQLINKKFNLSHAPHVCAVSCVNKRGIEDLKLAVNATAYSMKIPGRRNENLISRKVPKSYLDMEKAIADKTEKLTANNEPPVLTQAQFTEMLDGMKDDQLSSVEEIANITNFLAETGSLLHFSDQIGALNTLYFLDPAWFCDVLVHVLIHPDGKRNLKEGKGKISRSDVVKIYIKDERFPDEFIDQYIEMLERFEIAVTVDNFQKLFFPCKLPENPPLCDVMNTSGDYKVCRLYRMAECPSGFWTRLLTRMMTRVEHFSTNQWYFQPMLSQSIRKMTIRNPSFKNLRSSNTYHGLHLKNATKTFCREWMFVQHDEGSFCVEPVEGGGDEEGIEGDLQKGILVTEIDMARKFAAIGVIVDEIEDIIHDFYPGLLDPDEHTMQLRLRRYALCSSCYGNRPTIHNVNHFTMEHCARMLVTSDFINCPKGNQYKLEALVPDLLMKELPDKFILDQNLLQVVEDDKNCLGGGVAGSVFRGTYGNQEIAIKVYRSDIRNKVQGHLTHRSYNSTSSDSGTATISTQGSTGDPYAEIEGGEKIYANVSIIRSNIDLDETESIKAFKALKEMRQEVALTSRLQHPCIISLVGVAFSPKLMMALELAPLGSLRDVLNKEQDTRPVFRKYLDKDKDFPTIFNKELSFKFVYQIAKGLDYLHSHGIIYKDLKSDNILTMSLDIDDPVNLKLSDYGISKYSWGGRSVGLVGTPGYQAPEILDGLPYDEKVDIFSFSMVIYEILTGNRPFVEYDNVGQISKAIKTDDKRPNIREFRVKTNFPYLEDLMVQCWQKLGSDRPKASTIVTKNCMRNTQFIAQRSSTDFNASDNVTFAKDAVFGTSSEQGPPTLWIWEGNDEKRAFTVIDLEKSSFRFKKCSFYGPQVVCMRKVERQVWIGTKMNTIEVCGADSGVLEKIHKIDISSRPLQILSHVQKTMDNKEVVVYVAQNDGNLLKYQSQTNRRGAVRRQTRKCLDGFSNPQSCTLRTSNIHCMVLANQNTQLWISHSSYIDVLSCAEFKVIGDSQINLEILHSICGVPKYLDICCMTSNDTQVFCLLQYSPIVLEFDSLGNCTSVIEMSKRAIQNEFVSRKLNLTKEDHDAYHGHIPVGDRNSTTSISSVDSTGSDDHQDVTNSFENSVSFWIKREHKAKPLPVPPRPPKPLVHESSSRSSVVGSSPKPSTPSDKVTKGVPIPPRPDRGIHPAPPVVPPRLPKVSPDTPRRGATQRDSLSDMECSDRPDLPPRLRPSNRAMTLCSGRKGWAALRPQASQSLPNIYNSDRETGENQTMYDFHITSIQLVEDSLWAARSYGDVCVVDVNGVKASKTHGQVVASMKDLRDNKRECSNKEPCLVHVADYMAAAYNVDSDSSEHFEVASWDCHGADYFRKCDRFWTDLIKKEKDLANAVSCQSAIVSNSKVGTN